MRTINSTEVQYVRCIKPNALSKASLFDQPRVALQLRCAGVLEAIRIARLAYPNRMPHGAFVERRRKRYALLAPEMVGLLASARAAAAKSDGAAVRAACEKLLAKVVTEEGRFQLGKSKVFFRANLLEKLEGLRGRTLGTE
ncbi:P-loop containing nucleoside triphosphate hydrolase protein [Pavlovales sp. CCMP2436]|nr:P-loop containing nucleoside triphosphate hydrolase protein [Pavlovales sp. CCMP2436]